MKKYIFALLCLFTTVAQAEQSYVYKVRVLPPFGKVLINSSVICPNTTEGAICTIPDLQQGDHLVITGIKSHTCDYQIIEYGALQYIASNSFFCEGAQTQNATTTKPGYIVLPPHF